MPGQIQRGHAIGSLVLGIIEMVLGIVIIIVSVVASGKGNSVASVYWAGIVFIFPGILGVVTGITKNHCCMIASMVLNIIATVIQGIACVFIGIVVAWFSVIVSEINSYCTDGFSTCSCRYNGKIYNFNVDSCDTLKSAYSVVIGALVILVICGIVSLMASILGCSAVCCTNNNQGQSGVIHQGAINQGVVLNGGKM